MSASPALSESGGLEALLFVPQPFTRACLKSYKVVDYSSLRHWMASINVSISVAMNALKAAMDHTFVQENKATTEATDKRVQAITETFETFVDRLRNLVDAASEEQYQSRLQEVRDTYKELHSEDKRAIRDQIYTLCSSVRKSLETIIPNNC